MPPANMPRPDAAAKSAFITYLETGIDRAAAAKPFPGRTESIHRLNRAEYRNAVRDLLALDVDVDVDAARRRHELRLRQHRRACSR